MRKSLVLFAILLAVLLASAPIHAQAATSIVFNWTNNNNGLVTCSSTVTSACLVGHTITDTTVSGSPAVLSSAISPTASTYTTPVPAFTAVTRTYSIVLNYKDAAGTAQATTAVTTSVGVQFVVNPPTGFQATTK